MKLHQIRFWPLLILIMLVNILSQATHETGHRLIYQWTGHEPVWAFTKLVQIWETPPAKPDEWVKTRGSDGEQGWLKLGSPIVGKAEGALAAAAGPLAGLFGALLGLAVAWGGKRRRWRQIGLAFALTAALVAVLYYLRAPLRAGGDEYDLAIGLGVAKSFIEIPLALAFAACLAIGLRQLPSWRIRLLWLGTILMGSMATGLPMVIADSLIITQVDVANPWFRPVGGVALPVFLVNMLALGGIGLWSRWQDKSDAQST